MNFKNLSCLILAGVALQLQAQEPTIVVDNNSWAEWAEQISQSGEFDQAITKRLVVQR